MKTTRLILITFLTTTAFASEPTFKCVERTGFKFNFYLGSPVKIEMLDEQNELIRVIDGLELDSESIQNYPGVESYSVRYADDGNEVARVEFASDASQGEGEMIDNDNTMICQRQK